MDDGWTTTDARAKASALLTQSRWAKKRQNHRMAGACISIDLFINNITVWTMISLFIQQNSHKDWINDTGPGKTSRTLLWKVPSILFIILTYQVPYMSSGLHTIQVEENHDLPTLQFGEGFIDHGRLQDLIHTVLNLELGVPGNGNFRQCHTAGMF